MVKKKFKILVLGGSGFVGSRLVRALRQAGYKPFSASRENGTDLRDFKNAKKIFAKTRPDFIFNCAANVGSVHYVTKNAATVIHDNTLMALNIYKAAREVCPKAKIINPIANCAYPGKSSLLTETRWWDGEVHDSVYAYGNSKRFLYALSKCYEKQFGLKSVNFIVPNTFGPGDSADPDKTHALNGMIIRMIEAQKQGRKEFEIWGTGKPIREWAYVEDVVKVMIKGMAAKAGLNEPVNIGQKKGYSIKQSAQFIARALNFKGRLVFNTKYGDGAPEKIMDNKRFKKLFPKYKFFNHQKGIEETVKYYKSILKK